MAKLEIACFYTGSGCPEYRWCLPIMLQSARDHHPDAVLTHVTDRYTPSFDGFDRVMRMDEDIPHAIVVSAKLRFNAAWAQETDCEQTVFVDPDVIFNRPVEFGDWDIGVLYRMNAPHKTYNGGLIYSNNKAAGPFWKTAEYMVSRITKDVKQWWAEQLTLCCMLGLFQRPDNTLNFMGVRVGLLDRDEYCKKVREMPDKPYDTPTCHFTANKKYLMPHYYDLQRVQRTQSQTA